MRVQHQFRSFRDFLFNTTALRAIPRPPAPPAKMHVQTEIVTPDDDAEFGQLMGDEIVSPPPENLLVA